MNDVSNAYFEWLCSLVARGCPSPRSAFKKLLIFLHDVDFRYTIPRDSNRYGDGLYLRYRYSIASGIDQNVISMALDNKPCSVLEMMVALAVRCEEQVMSNMDFGDRTGSWFWYMIDNLGLSGMTNKNFDKSYCSMVVERFLNREYESNGRGGLFTVNKLDRNNQLVDLRDCEIWYQATWYMNELLEGG